MNAMNRNRSVTLRENINRTSGLHMQIYRIKTFMQKVLTDFLIVIEKKKKDKRAKCDKVKLLLQILKEIPRE